MIVIVWTQAKMDRTKRRKTESCIFCICFHCQVVCLESPGKRWIVKIRWPSGRVCGDRDDYISCSKNQLKSGWHHFLALGPKLYKNRASGLSNEHA